MNQVNRIGRIVLCGTLAVAALAAPAARQGPWTKEKAWEWYNAQPWIRGCNYMPASAANRVDQWQSLGAEERFAEVERELALAEKVGFNTLRLVVEHQGVKLIAFLKASHLAEKAPAAPGRQVKCFLQS